MQISMYKMHEEQQNNFVVTGQNKCDRSHSDPWLLTNKQTVTLTELLTYTGCVKKVQPPFSKHPIALGIEMVAWMHLKSND